MNEFTVRRGNPTPEELAIAISVLRTALAANSAIGGSATAPRSNWAAPHRAHRATRHRVGPGMWTLAQRMR